MASSSTVIIAEEELQGLIFDCDGTLIHTMPAYWRSWVETCRQYGIDFSEQRFYAMAGVPVRDIFKIIINESFPQGGGPDLDAVMSTKQAFGKISIVEIGMPRVDVVVAIAEKYHGKIPMAVASSGHREFVMESLEKNGILHYFDAVITGEDVTNPKVGLTIYFLLLVI
jgi:beta-phosphoglucomutase-like phosphatase (HAD superfamily)